jgi:hypothetical protein
MPQTSGSGMVGADRPEDENVTWTAATVIQNGEAEGDTVAPDPEARDEIEATIATDDVVDESLELDLTAPEPAETNGISPAPASDRASELEGEHWRERAIVWRERAMAAELVAKMLQRNLDDLRSNLEDLRLKVEAAAEADAARTAAITSSQTPWRRFVRDMYDKYLG